MSTVAVSIEVKFSPHQDPAHLRIAKSYATLHEWCQYADQASSDPRTDLFRILTFLQSPQLILSRATKPVKVLAIAMRADGPETLQIVGDPRDIPLPVLKNHQTHILLETSEHETLWLNYLHAKDLLIHQHPGTQPLTLPRLLTPQLLVFNQPIVLPITSSGSFSEPLTFHLSPDAVNLALSPTADISTLHNSTLSQSSISLSLNLTHDSGSPFENFEIDIALTATPSHLNEFHLETTEHFATLSDASPAIEKIVQRFLFCYQQYLYLHTWLFHLTGRSESPSAATAKSATTAQLLFPHISLYCEWSLSNCPCLLHHQDSDNFTPKTLTPYSCRPNILFSPTELQPIIQLVAPLLTQAELNQFTC